MERPDPDDARHLRRTRRTVEATPDLEHPERVRVDGRELLNFCSNDYLGLRTHPALIEAAGRSLQRDGLGAGAAHLVSGHSLEHHALEAEQAAEGDDEGRQPEAGDERALHPSHERADDQPTNAAQPPRQADRGGDQLGDDERRDGGDIADREVDLRQDQNPDLGRSEQDVGRRLDEQIDEVAR